jgi:hypothetical protein
MIKVKLIENRKLLRSEDLELLAKVDPKTVTTMMQNRVVLERIRDDSDNKYDINGLFNDDSFDGYYYVKLIGNPRSLDDHWEIWFERPYDLQKFKKKLFMAKLSDK